MVRLQVGVLIPVEGAYDEEIAMHDRLYDSTSLANQGTKIDCSFAEMVHSSSPPTSNDPVSAGAVAHTRCECLDKLRQYAATPADLSKPNFRGQSTAWFDASARRARIENAYAASDLSNRAELIAKYRIMPSCTCARALIESVANASVTGVLVQSHLAGPVQESPRILKMLVEENQRKYAVALMPKRKRLKTRRRSPLLDMLSHPSSAANTETK